MRLKQDFQATQVVRILVLLMFLIYGLGLTPLFQFNREAIVHYHAYWQLVTLHFAHHNLSHVIGDGIAFYLLGAMVYVRSKAQFYVLLGLNCLIEGPFFLYFMSVDGLAGSSGMCYSFLAWILLDALTLSASYRAWGWFTGALAVGAFFIIWNIKLYHGMLSIAGGKGAYVPAHILSALIGVVVFCVYRVWQRGTRGEACIPFFVGFKRIKT